MRINKYVASASALSRRAADTAISAGRVKVNNRAAEQGMEIVETDTVTLDGDILQPAVSVTTIMLNKPIGYVCSRDGQGSRTIYDLLPPEYRQLNPVGRLDKDSSGLLLLTNDGQLAQQLTHPRYQKTKLYEVTLDKPLEPLHQQIITDYGITLEDGISRFSVTRIEPAHSAGASEKRAGKERADSEQSEAGTRGRGKPLLKNGSRLDTDLYQITITEGRNRQIRRTFAALGYTVTTLHRTYFGPYSLDSLKTGQVRAIPSTPSD